MVNWLVVTAKLPVARTTRKRRGLSLIEVIIAMGILVGTTAVLAQLIHVGEKQATRSIDMSEAQTLCHNKMAELMSGLSMLVPIENEPVSVDSPWDYSVRIEPVGLGDLHSLTVIINRRQTEIATSVAAAQRPRFVRLSCDALGQRIRIS